MGSYFSFKKDPGIVKIVLHISKSLNCQTCTFILKTKCKSDWVYISSCLVVTDSKLTRKIVRFFFTKFQHQIFL